MAHLRVAEYTAVGRRSGKGGEVTRDLCRHFWLQKVFTSTQAALTAMSIAGGEYGVMTTAGEVRGVAQKQARENSRIGLSLGRSAARPGCALNLLEPRLMVSPTTGIIPFDDRIILVSLLNCPEFSSRLSEVAQTLNAISGLQVLDVWRWLGEAWLLGTVRVSDRAGV